MLKLGWVTKVKVFLLVLVYVFNIDLFEFFGRHFRDGSISLVLFIREIIISVLKKIDLFPLFPRYLTLYNLFPEHIALKVSENKGIV